jgi:uncharacterized membrane protein YfcA
MTPDTWGLALAVLGIAILYSTVGHGGASGYLAVMALFGVAPLVMRPTALTLNIVVASLAVFYFARGGWFSWRLFLPFAVTSIPAAAVGGAMTLADPVYRWLVGGALVVAAYQLARTAGSAAEPGVKAPLTGVALLIGAGLGFLAGLTGVGGGIFLSPLLLAAGWAGAKETATASAAFILVNSIAALAAHAVVVGGPPVSVWLLVAVAGVGGTIGSRLGSGRFGGSTIRRLLAVVLLMAGMKFLLT